MPIILSLRPAERRVGQRGGGWQNAPIPGRLPHDQHGRRLPQQPTAATADRWTCDGTWPKPYGVNDGMLGEGKGYNIEQVQDGTSNTLLVGELTGAGPSTYIGQFWVTWNLAGMLNGINGYLTVPGGLKTGYNIRTTGFSSFHPGGCHFLMADGSARFLLQTLDHRTLLALTTRAKGKTKEEQLISGF